MRITRDADGRFWLHLEHHGRKAAIALPALNVKTIAYAVLSGLATQSGEAAQPEHFVVVAENDGPDCFPYEDWLDYHASLGHRAYYPQRHTGPLVWETYLGENSSSLAAAREGAERLTGRYGKVRIARLDFLPEEA